MHRYATTPPHETQATQFFVDIELPQAYCAAEHTFMGGAILPFNAPF
jgi:hypothetical protein